MSLVSVKIVHAENAGAWLIAIAALAVLAFFFYTFAQASRNGS